MNYILDEVEKLETSLYDIARMASGPRVGFRLKWIPSWLAGQRTRTNG